MRSSQEQAEKAAKRGKRDHGQNQADPLPGAESGIQDERHEEQRDWHNDRKPPIGALLTLVFASPVQVIALGQFDLLTNFFDCLPHGAAEVAAAHAVLDGNIAGVAFAVNRGRTIVEGNGAQLCQGDSFSGRGQDADVADVFDRAAELRLITDGEVVPLLSDEDLSQSLSAHGGFDCVLNIADVDTESVGGGAVYV